VSAAFAGETVPTTSAIAATEARATDPKERAKDRIQNPSTNGKRPDSRARDQSRGFDFCTSSKKPKQ